jgi:cytochrome c-type biogenesis protein CcmF
VTSDFSLNLVVANSHTDKPMLYKVTGVWGNHEGSMLLWVLILTLFGAMAAWFGSNLPPTLKARVLAVQSSVAVAFFAFILFTSNPFTAARFPPFDGQDLNPLLQDPGLAFHPPFLYLGYVGPLDGLLLRRRRPDRGPGRCRLGRWVRPWTLAAWVFLTIGIGLGSWWAYYELGWGGFWFWDPVENASFMPWLIAAALLHSAIVVEKREALKSWTILLAILAFGFSLIGTFIVRSGVMTSVHAFATDPERGVFILMILGSSWAARCSLFALRAGRWRPRASFPRSAAKARWCEQPPAGGLDLRRLHRHDLAAGGRDVLRPQALGRGPSSTRPSRPSSGRRIGPADRRDAAVETRAGRVKAHPPLVPAMVLAVACGLLAWAMQTGKTILGPIGVGPARSWLVAARCRSGRAPGAAVSATGWAADTAAARRLGQDHRPCGRRHHHVRVVTG